MSDDQKQNSSAAGGRKADKAERADRLAEALRENLRRRKTQARTRGAAKAPEDIAAPNKNDDEA